MKVLKINAQGKTVQPPRWTKETPMEILTKNRIASFVELRLPNVTDPTVHLDVVEAVNIINKAAQCLCVGLTAFDTEYDNTLSDGMYNIHTIYLTPRIGAGVLAMLQERGELPRLVMIIAHAGAYPGISWGTYEEGMPIASWVDEDVVNPNMVHKQVHLVDPWVVADVVVEKPDDSVTTSSDYKPRLVISDNWCFTSPSNLMPIDFSQWR